MKNNKYKTGFQVVVLLLICNATSFAKNKISEGLSLKKGWKFHLRDLSFTEIKGHGMTYENAKTGRALGVAGSRRKSRKTTE
jgi:beta-galactosidase